MARSSIPRVRSVLYRAAYWLGWLRAAQTGTLGKRLERVLLGRIAGRIIGRLTR